MCHFILPISETSISFWWMVLKMSQRKVDIELLTKIYDYTVKGYTKRKIAELLGISITTVGKYQRKYDFV